MGHREFVDDHLAVRGGGITLAGVGLRVAPGFEVTAGRAHVVGVDVAAVVVTLHAAVPGHKLHGEDVAQLIIRGQHGAVDAVLVHEQFGAFEAEHTDVVPGVVDLAGDHVRLDDRRVGVGLGDLHRVGAGGGGPTRPVDAVIDHFTQLGARVTRTAGGRAAAGRGEHNSVEGAVDVEITRVLIAVQRRLGHFIGTSRGRG